MDVISRRCVCGFCWLFVLPLALALYGAKHGNRFIQQRLVLKSGDGARLECMVLRPRTAKPVPVVIFIQGAGVDLVRSGWVLRKIVALGMAAVAMDYNKANSLVGLGQLRLVSEFLDAQGWVQQGAVCWLGSSLGSQRKSSLS